MEQITKPHLPWAERFSGYILSRVNTLLRVLLASKYTTLKVAIRPFCYYKHNFSAPELLFRRIIFAVTSHLICDVTQFSPHKWNLLSESELKRRKWSEFLFFNFRCVQYAMKTARYRLQVSFSSSFPLEVTILLPNPTRNFFCSSQISHGNRVLP